MDAIEKINIRKEKPLFLVAPLDWGLGHTTRSIPLVRELIKQGCEVIVACNSVQSTILRTEFPSLRLVALGGYGIRYGVSGTATRWKLLLQVPKILMQIKKEKRWLASFLLKNPVDAVISDNRYGIYSRNTPSVLVTHQLNIRSGQGKMADRTVQYFLYQLIGKFKECWIPDFETNDLAGALSHPAIQPRIPTHYIGCLSRFANCKTGFENHTTTFLFILSGPEPQRTIFENIIMHDLKSNPRNSVVVRGLPEEKILPDEIPGVTIVNHASTTQLNELICNAALVVCRAGYTTIMDMMQLQKKIVVVPTPGQGEQEYLASYLSGKKYLVNIAQNRFSIAAAEQAAGAFAFQLPQPKMEHYQEVIGRFIQTLRRY